jgi:hypothetical protein
VDCLAQVASMNEYYRSALVWPLETVLLKYKNRKYHYDEILADMNLASLVAESSVRKSQHYLVCYDWKIHLEDLYWDW